MSFQNEINEVAKEYSLSTESFEHALLFLSRQQLQTITETSLSAYIDYDSDNDDAEAIDLLKNILIKRIMTQISKRQTVNTVAEKHIKIFETTRGSDEETVYCAKVNTRTYFDKRTIKSQLMNLYSKQLKVDVHYDLMNSEIHVDVCGVFHRFGFAKKHMNDISRKIKSMERKTTQKNNDSVGKLHYIKNHISDGSLIRLHN